MKVTHITYSDAGGAGIAAVRLNNALLASTNIESRILCLHKTTKGNNIYQYKKSLASRIISNLPNREQFYFHEICKLGGQYECFSIPYANYDITKHHLIQDADIINLHWIGNMLNYPSFFRHVRQPIIWTLHDMNPFLGIAHYTGDLQNNTNCINIENKIRIAKEKAIHRKKDITIVNLCNWMKTHSEQSDCFSRYKHTIIYNSINTSIFKLYNKKYIRKILNLPENNPILLFCSQNVNNPRKGFDLLKEAIQKIHRECVFLAIGNTTYINMPNVILFGEVHDEVLMALLYSAADAFILPSREDNLPNTMLESLCCGVPVIATPNGGMRDIIIKMENGIITKETSADAIAEAITMFLDNREFFNSLNISSQAHKQFAPEIQAEKYSNLYSDTVNNYV